MIRKTHNMDLNVPYSLHCIVMSLESFHLYCMSYNLQQRGGKIYK